MFGDAVRDLLDPRLRGGGGRLGAGAAAEHGCAGVDQRIVHYRRRTTETGANGGDRLSGTPGVASTVPDVKHVDSWSLDREEHLPGRTPPYQHLANLIVEGSTFRSHGVGFRQRVEALDLVSNRREPPLCVGRVPRRQPLVRLTNVGGSERGDDDAEALHHYSAVWVANSSKKVDAGTPRPSRI